MEKLLFAYVICCLKIAIYKIHFRISGCTGNLQISIPVIKMKESGEMKGKQWFIILMLILLFCSAGFSQIDRPKELKKAKIAPEEIISMSKTMPFNQALDILNFLSKKFYDKVIIDPEAREIPIGIDVDKMYWFDAFELILRKNILWYEEFPDYLKLVKIEQPPEPVIEEAAAPEPETKGDIYYRMREVVISAIFFEADGSKLRQMGFNWDLLRDYGVDIAARMSAAETKTGLLEVEVAHQIDFVNLVAVFKAMENDQIGEVVASPQITVRSEQEGKIQVGSDVAVTIKDFAGNSVTQMFSTGSIIKVTPEVLKHDSTFYIHLDLDIERSNTSTGNSGLEIKKSFAQTSVLLLDGEETIIGGLYVNEESHTREGIPFLKNLPWWFFGMRYLFGFEAKRVVKKELIILLHAELLPTLEERLQQKMMNKAIIDPTLLRNRMKFWREIKEYLNKANQQDLH